MRYTRAAEYARANLAAVREMLAATDSPITRVNLEARIEDLEQELRSTERKATTLAEAEVLFDGAPVKTLIGIDAVFGGTGVRAFEELVATVTADLAGPVGKSGPLPRDVPRLLITDVAVGSFGFQLAEVPDQEPDQGSLIASPLKDALNEATRLLVAVGESDEAFAEAVAKRQSRVLAKLKEFLNVVDGAGATLKVDTGQVRMRLDTTNAVRAARERADATILVETPETVVGVLSGLMQGRSRFEIRTDGGDLITGRIDADADVASLVALYDQRVVASLRSVTAGRGGSTRTAWFILSAVPQVSIASDA